jgi:amino acid transporter
VLKRLLIGRPLASEDAPHQLLPKALALPVFSSDALSSVAYATEEIMLVLVLAGTARLGLTSPLALGIAALLAIVVVSYRQTVRAYPSGGGAYIVSRANLGVTPGLVAAGALLVDYVLTVAVSVVAGVDAITSAASGLSQHRVLLATGFIALITLANLRGVKESGTLFAVPTYAFIASIFVMLAVGAARCVDGCPAAAVDPRVAEHLGRSTQALGLFLVLRAFSSGATALTGVEAISNGVPAFRRPQARNAATTLAIMGAISITMFLGISLLAHALRVLPISAETASELGVHQKTVVAQIAETIFGGGALFYVVQATTALILVLAANTSYQDFPRLASILARDRFVPRQFMNRGDRLVFSNGVVALAVFASILVFLFDADTTRLIQLYVVGVFTSFTLSQTGMVRHWMRERGRGWRRSAVINGIGAIATAVVLAVVTATKFVHGAYIVVIAIPLIVAGFRAVHRHYASVAGQLRLPSDRPIPDARTHVVIPVARTNEATMRAVGYAKALRPLSIHAVHVAENGEGEALRAAWTLWDSGIPLNVLPRADLVRALRAYVHELPRLPEEFVTVVVPEALRGRSWAQFIRRRRALMLKTALLFEPQVAVTDMPAAETGRPSGPLPRQPARSVAVVLISAVHNASLRAVAYARALRPTDLRVVTFNVDERETPRMIGEWSRSGVEVPLEVLDSPYREVRRPLLKFVRALRDQAPGTVVTVVLPEFVVRKWWHQFLHNQTALAIKARLLFEPGVVVTSVPFHLR